MNKTLFTLIAVVATIFVGCQHDIPADNSATNDGKTVLTVAVASPRTSLGEKSNGSYPVYWSNGDKLALNGVVSETTTVDAENPTVAKFTFGATLRYPYNVTYPYTSTTTAEAPKVEFLAEQNYVEGSFCEGSAPMYGYIANSGNKADMRHLAGVLSLAVKSQTEGICLEKIVITSTDNVKLSGEFSVDCQNGTLTPTDNTSNSVTYLLPSDFALSTTDESKFYIALPAGDMGATTVMFVDSNGDTMTGSLSSSNLKVGIVREIAGIVYKPGVICTLPSFTEDSDVLEDPYPNMISGTVKDSSGNGIAGVAVSDGFSVVKTNASGRYALNASTDAWYINISIPSEYDIPMNQYGQPCFYQRYSADKKKYDFTLTPLAGGKESKFALFVLTDLHISTAYRQARFEYEALPSILAHSKEVKKSIPCYGLALGDLIDNSNTKNTSAERVNVRALLTANKLGFPLFNTMGNHDNTYFDASSPAESDETSSTFNLKAQRDHEDLFGPVNYSFNRGDVHIVAMRNIIYTSHTASNTYDVGFTDEQWEWLKQDLALVPKDKMVVLGTHIKMHNESKNHISEVTALLGEYKEAHIFTGHSHIQRNYPTSGSTKKVFEHNLGAICGSSWYCKMGEDGTPNGYNVFVGEGATFSDWYRMAYNKRLDSRAQQMRLYRGNAVTGAKMPSAPGTTDNPEGVKGFYKFNFAENVLLANVYNADSKWSIKVYEDGEYSGDMTLLPSTNYSMSTLIGDGSKANPFRFAADVSTGQDLYTAGLLMGIQGRYKNGAPLGNCWSNNYHMYKYELKNKDAAIKVVAIDRFGNEYTETQCTLGTDYTLTSGDYKSDVKL